jgi:hypothetical protein
MQKTSGPGGKLPEPEEMTGREDFLQTANGGSWCGLAGDHSLVVLFIILQMSLKQDKTLVLFP